MGVENYILCDTCKSYAYLCKTTFHYPILEYTSKEIKNEVKEWFEDFNRKDMQEQSHFKKEFDYHFFYLIKLVQFVIKHKAHQIRFISEHDFEYLGGGYGKDWKEELK